ncbi:hypothetical protein M758_4G032000 [Ceratodon purpureus]|nr:hypothetical protein M758_4G032000 [Ceratodon purpureus]
MLSAWDMKLLPIRLKLGLVLPNKSAAGIAPYPSRLSWCIRDCGSTTSWPKLCVEVEIVEICLSNPV